MNRRAFVILSVSALGLVTYLAVTGRQQIQCEEVVLRCTEGDARGDYEEVSVPALDCQKLGVVQMDGGQLGDDLMGCRAVKCKGVDCIKDKKKESFGCAMRPRGIPNKRCMRLTADGGTYDFGDENVMAPGEWVGDGCEPCPCVVVSGIPWKKKR